MKLELQKAEDGGYVVKRKAKIRVIAKSETADQTALAVGRAALSFLEEAESEPAGANAEVDADADEDGADGGVGGFIENLSDRALATAATEVFSVFRKLSRSGKKKDSSITTEATESEEKKEE
jgi:hypothetical protein